MCTVFEILLQRLEAVPGGHDSIIIIMSKPPALPGDSQSLTFPGV
jgi:hypothetical protein